MTEKQGGTVTGHYVYGVTRLSRDDGTNFLYYQVDGLGSARQLTDDTEAVAKTYLFEAFGSLVAQSGTAENPYQFAGSSGYRNDGDAGLMHVGARYYDPQVGRFTTADPVLGNIYLPQTLNRYVYVINNPVNSVDPTGRIVVTIILGALIIGGFAVAGAIIGGISGGRTGAIGGAISGGLVGIAVVVALAGAAPVWGAVAGVILYAALITILVTIIVFHWED